MDNIPVHLASKIWIYCLPLFPIVSEINAGVLFKFILLDGRYLTMRDAVRGSSELGNAAELLRSFLLKQLSGVETRKNILATRSRSTE